MPNSIVRVATETGVYSSLLKNWVNIQPALTDLLNDQVIPLFDEHGVMLQRVLIDLGTEYCVAPERHEYELYMAIEDIDHGPHQG